MGLKLKYVHCCCSQTNEIFKFSNVYPGFFSENYYNQFPVRYTRKQWPCPTSQSVLLDNHGNKPQSGPTSVVRTITPYYLHCYRRNYLVFPVDFRPLLLSGTPDNPSNIAWTLPAKFSTQTQLSAGLLVLHQLCQTPSQCGIYPAKRKSQMFAQHMYRF